MASMPTPGACYGAMQVTDGEASAAMITKTAQPPGDRWREIEARVRASGLSNDPTVQARCAAHLPRYGPQAAPDLPPGLRRAR